MGIQDLEGSHCWPTEIGFDYTYFGGYLKGAEYFYEIVSVDFFT